VVCWLAFLLAWRLAILTGICHDLLKYSGQILPDSFLDLISHLHVAGYLSILILVLNVFNVFVDSKDLSYTCEKSMLSDPLMAMTAFFFHILLISVYIIILSLNSV